MSQIVIVMFVRQQERLETRVKKSRGLGTMEAMRKGRRMRARAMASWRDADGDEGLAGVARPLRGGIKPLGFFVWKDERGRGLGRGGVEGNMRRRGHECRWIHGTLEEEPGQGEIKQLGSRADTRHGGSDRKVD